MNQHRGINIIYEDNHLLVVNKPSGISTQRNQYEKDFDLCERMKDYLRIKKNKESIDQVFLALINRIDKPVSGLVLLAKTSKAASRLNEDMKNHKIQKNYYALVEGHIDGSHICEDIIDQTTYSNENGIQTKEKIAKLSFQSIQKISQPFPLSLLKVQLETGRKHQIRIQLSKLGHPIYGDTLYNSKFKWFNKKSSIIPLIALHAINLSIIHPILKTNLSFIAPLPDTWNQLVKQDLKPFF